VRSELATRSEGAAQSWRRPSLASGSLRVGRLAAS